MEQSGCAVPRLCSTGVWRLMDGGLRDPRMVVETEGPHLEVGQRQLETHAQQYDSNRRPLRPTVGHWGLNGLGDIEACSRRSQRLSSMQWAPVERWRSATRPTGGPPFGQAGRWW